MKLRAFQIVYTILTLNFIIPAFLYLFAPEFAWSSLKEVATLFGASHYPYSESSLYWRILGFGNVMTLGFMCALLLFDLRKYYPTLVPLVFLKGCSAFGFLGVYLWVLDYPLFLIAFLFDGLTLAAMIYFARTARNALS
ncbi:MAG: hypothetical protein CME06_15935 [Gemmatimonadetes bacterium]|nr:hypothetical protein [Gemmatimonadota bacterium]